MSAFEVSTASLERVGFGEGPHWEAKEKVLYYVDCFEKSVTKLDFLSQGKPCQTSFPIDVDVEFISAAIPTDNNGGNHKDFIVSAKEKLIMFSPSSTQPVTLLHQVYGGHLHDATCDSKGRFWVGEWKDGPTPAPGSNPDFMEEFAARFEGGLCSFDWATGFQRRTTGISGPNGICFSPDETMVYTVDCVESKVIGQEFNIEEGSVGTEEKIVFELDQAKLNYHPKAILDGMVVDAKGNLWAVIYMEGKVLNIDVQTGKIVNEIFFEAPLTTSLCFGGEQLNELFVTTCHVPLPNWSDRMTLGPQSGHTFRATCEKDNSFKGTILHNYQGSK